MFDAARQSGMQRSVEDLSVNTFRTVMPHSVNQALARVQKAAAVSCVSSQRSSHRPGGNARRWLGMQKVVAAHGLVVGIEQSRALVRPGVVIALGVRPNMRQPPPAGILPRFLTSMWTRSPTDAASMRRTTRPVGRSSQRNLASPIASKHPLDRRGMDAQQ